MSSDKCPYCGFSLSNSPVTINTCPNCKKTIKHEIGHGWMSEEQVKKNQQMTAVGALVLLAALAVVLPLLWKLLKLIINFFRKKPKTAIVITLVLVFVLHDVINNTAAKQYERAEAMLLKDSSSNEAVSLLKSASGKKYVPAMIKYAEILANGKCGVEVDHTAAFNLLSEAIAIGISFQDENHLVIYTAYYELAKLYEKGQGTEKNYDLARKNYSQTIGIIDNAEWGCARTTALMAIDALEKKDYSVLDEIALGLSNKLQRNELDVVKLFPNGFEGYWNGKLVQDDEKDDTLFWVSGDTRDETVLVLVRMEVNSEVLYYVRDVQNVSEIVKEDRE